MVNDFYDGSKLSILRATVDEDNTSNLNQSPGGCSDLSVTHCDDVLIPRVQSVGCKYPG
jgi:hypothetical protein